MNARVTELSNGFRIATDNMPGIRTAAVAVHVRVGGRHERREQNGLAHFLEHMAFKGTSTRSAFEISEAIEEVGGYLNAYTSRETTAYLACALGDDVPLALDLVSDILLDSVYDTKEMELERGVILSEIGEYEDSPTDMVFDSLQRTAYPDQPFGRPIIGTNDRVSSFGRDDLVGFVGEHYGPNRMIMTTAGDVDHDSVVGIAEERFGALDPIPAPQHVSSEFKGGISLCEKDVEQIQFALAFEGPPVLDRWDPVARIYSVILGGGSSSRLFAEAREKRGLCYSISASAAPGSDTGAIILHASTGKEELTDLAEVCARQIDEMAKTVTEREVKRAKTQLRVAMLMAQESPMHRIERNGGMLALLGKLQDVDETIAKFDAVTIEDIRQFAERVAGRSTSALALYGPISESPDLPDMMGRTAE